MSKTEFMQDVYDNLMKNTHYNPRDFSQLKTDAHFDADENLIHMGDFVLAIKTFDEYVEEMR